MDGSRGARRPSTVTRKATATAIEALPRHDRDLHASGHRGPDPDPHHGCFPWWSHHGCFPWWSHHGCFHRPQDPHPPAPSESMKQKSERNGECGRRADDSDTAKCGVDNALSQPVSNAFHHLKFHINASSRKQPKVGSIRWEADGSLRMCSPHRMPHRIRGLKPASYPITASDTRLRYHITASDTWLRRCRCPCRLAAAARSSVSAASPLAPLAAVFEPAEVRQRAAAAAADGGELRRSRKPGARCAPWWQPLESWRAGTAAPLDRAGCPPPRRSRAT